MFVIYSNDSEILVTTQKLEDKMLKEWFSEETGRSLDEYDRVWSSDTAVGIKAATRLV